ncbi:hypothetical protein ACHFCA_09510 [Delftia tsuruhatensis]
MHGVQQVAEQQVQFVGVEFGHGLGDDAQQARITHFQYGAYSHGSAR